MKLFDTIAGMGHEQVVLSHDPAAGYRGIIAIHSTVLGPALGGTRFWKYATDEEAIVDALRLARGMTYKNAVAGLNLGGGKSVIIGDNKTTDRELIFRAHGRFVACDHADSGWDVVARERVAASELAQAVVIHDERPVGVEFPWCQSRALDSLQQRRSGVNDRG